MVCFVGFEQERAIGPVGLRNTLFLGDAGRLDGLLVARVVLEKSLQDFGPAYKQNYLKLVMKEREWYFRAIRNTLLR